MKKLTVNEMKNVSGGAQIGTNYLGCIDALQICCIQLTIIEDNDVGGSIYHCGDMEWYMNV